MMMKFKYLGFALLTLGFISCESDDMTDAPAPQQTVELTAGEADFSNYVAVGASFTAGVSDNAVFIAAQTNSFPNTLATQFAAVGGGDFNLPYVSDNVGGLLFGGNLVYPPRLYFDGAGPAVLEANPTTELTNVFAGVVHNLGVPGAKSYHLSVPGYGDIAGVPLGTANPYFARMASSPSITMLEQALATNPTFFTLSEMGGNDVLSYATSGGQGVDQTGNPDPTTYSSRDITDPTVFTASVTAAVDALTANGAKGCLTTVPYVTSLPLFTTVPHAPLTPDALGGAEQIQTLNTTFGALNAAFSVLGAADRSITFSETGPSAIVIFDKDLPNIADQLNAVLQGGGLDPLTAGLLSAQFGQARQATSADLVLLPASGSIGTVNDENYQFVYDTVYGALVAAGLPEEAAAATAAEQAGQFSVNGVTFPFADGGVLTEQETARVITATDAYNASVDAICTQYDLAKVDLRVILEGASQSGIMFDDFMMTTQFVMGGLVSLDGVHFTARGYALMANAFLEAIDAKYGSNFIEAGQRAYANDFPVQYSPELQ
ncbi:MAG: G-D-S-L family lipolytic protein [Flavobacteriaceae bacterium]